MKLGFFSFLVINVCVILGYVVYAVFMEPTRPVHGIPSVNLRILMHTVYIVPHN